MAKQRLNMKTLRAYLHRRPGFEQKYPRKIKKVWKRVLGDAVRAAHGRSGYEGPRYTLHWSPFNGWTVTKDKRKCNTWIS